MKCERCGEDTEVHPHSVDGFTGYLCDSCLTEWGTVQED